jgi:hypothetical protein
LENSTLAGLTNNGWIANPWFSRMPSCSTRRRILSHASKAANAPIHVENRPFFG